MTASNLFETLHSAFPDGITVLNIAPSADLAATWASTDLEQVQPGDLYIANAVEVTPKVLRDLKARGACAVLILGEIPGEFPSLPSDLPLLHLIGEHDKRLVCRQVLAALLSSKSALLERGLRLYKQFSDLVAEGAGLEGLVEAFVDISTCGALIQDKRGDILAECASPDLLSIWQAVLDGLRGLDSLPAQFLDRKNAAVSAGLVIQPIPGGLFRLLCPVTVAGVVRGYLSLVSTGAEFDPLDRLVVEQGAVICAIEMSRKKAIRETEKRLKGDLLTALLQENLSPRDAELWVEAMGLDISQAHAALRFVWDGENPPSRRRLETLVNGEVSRLNLKVILSTLGLEVICFCQVSPEASRPTDAVSLAEAVVAAASREYPDKSIRCGVGSPVGELSEWRISFRQAGQALAMARRFGGARPLYFPDLSVYRLLMQIEHNPELVAFLEETLGRLSAHDNCREMIHTLDAYFEHNGNISQTATALFVHRNTLIYRLERIAAILDLDLENPENRLAIQLALRIYRMKGLC